MVQLEATASSQDSASRSGAVVKVSYNEEVLRFRVGLPLDLNEIRSTIFSTLLSSASWSGYAGDGQEASATPTASHMVLTYSGPNDTHVELCDATAQDFILRHSESAQPIRLKASAHATSCLQQLPSAGCTEALSNFQQLPLGSSTEELIETALDDSQTSADSSSLRDAHIADSTIAVAPVVAAAQCIGQDSASNSDDDFVMVNADQCHEPVMATPAAMDSDCVSTRTGEPQMCADADAGVLAGLSTPDLDLSGAVEFEDIKADLSASLATSSASVAPALTLSQKICEVSVPEAAAARSADSESSSQPATVGEDFLSSSPGSASATQASTTTGHTKDAMGEDFLSSAPGSASATQTSTTAHSLGGVSLPVAARAAAYAVSDVLENARDKLSEAFSTSRSSMASPHEMELQRALFASVELQRAIEISAAESRARLSKVLDLYKVKLRPVMADGNCQFRALSVQICGDESHHAAIRQRIIQQLLEKRHRYEGSHLGTFEDYVKRMACDGEWGDNLTLQAASDLLNCDIQILTDNMGLLELHPEDQQGTKKEQSLCLAFLTEVHYDAVIIETA